MKKFKKLMIILVVFNIALLSGDSLADKPAHHKSRREQISMDFGWRFALGHASDNEKDFKHGTAYFSQFAKAGWDIKGPSSPDFDDSSWRVLDLPHDWAVELPFDPRGGHSHGYKALGRDFPENSVGWYRKSFLIHQSDLGKRIYIKFDGIFRHSEVWINGFYCGLEPGGYNEIIYDITDYINYGGDNVVVVRVDATMEEGWFYEGAGIYRHVLLIKTDPLHIDHNGIFVKSEVGKNSATLTVRSTVINDYSQKEKYVLNHFLTDPAGRQVFEKQSRTLKVNQGESLENSMTLKVKKPQLWSVDAPNLYQLTTTIIRADEVIDCVKTTFGIRTIRFDPDYGFFLNGKPVKIKGTNNHQDHAGVGTAVPDALQEFRIQRLKDMGCNAYRCAHHPPAPELLDACDRLGMLVLDENRLMGSTTYTLRNVEKMIKRDWNHPSVILWSLGNEEWAIEGNIRGERIAKTMQDFARKLDDTRPFTIASSGGWGKGVSLPIEVMGFNYIRHGNTDEFHRNFPNKPCVGTEESTTQGTRGIYENNEAKGHLKPTDRTESGSSIETGWKYYAARPYLAGLFYWTGFDYRGESNPLDFPAISSQFGILDLCGFPKDPYYYLKAWWKEEPSLYIAPHWNWPGKEGKFINVWVHSNCQEVELFLNDNSLGRKSMEENSHLEWKVKYTPGILRAEGYKNGQKIITAKNETTGEAAQIELIPHKKNLTADGRDVSVITVKITDDKKRLMPTAGNEVTFAVKGPGKIIGVGNGDPGCHEADKIFDKYDFIKINDLRYKSVANQSKLPELAPDFDDSAWPLHIHRRNQKSPAADSLIVVRGVFELPLSLKNRKFTLFGKSLCQDQTLYINGQPIAEKVKREAPNQVYPLAGEILQPGKNVYTVVGYPLTKRHQWEELNTDPGIIQMITPHSQWKRSAFNGLAQVILQAEKEPGRIVLTARSKNLTPASIEISSKESDEKKN